MKLEQKRQALRGFIEELKEAGFKVYAPKELTTYCKFTKNNRIGYVEAGDFGWNFSTVHKPSKECGTGYSIYRDKLTATIQDALDCFIYKPDWASSSDIVVKYKNFEDYNKNSTYGEYIEY